MSLFKLAKLQIEAYKDSARKTKLSMVPGASTFEVMYNPESFSLKYESEFQKAAGVGAGSQPARFVRSGAKVLNLKLIIDGTRVSMLPVEFLLGAPPSVAEKVDAFVELCFVRQGEIHEPSYLRVLWGAGPLQAGFDCRLKSVDVNYTSFDRDGSPLRAELSVSFVEALDPPKLAAKERLSSPDLTHLRTVAAGDTLPLLCAEIYGSSRHYLRVATANGLDDFRELVPGTQLHFPPYDKGDKGKRGAG
jgi:hypothetical protein